MRLLLPGSLLPQVRVRRSAGGLLMLEGLLQRLPRDPSLYSLTHFQCLNFYTEITET